jgi:hypothetical protein
MMNHHLAGLLGLGCLSWSGHQIHIAFLVNKLLDAGVAPQEIPLPHEFFNVWINSQYTQASQRISTIFSVVIGENIQIS